MSRLDLRLSHIAKPRFLVTVLGLVTLILANNIKQSTGDEQGLDRLRGGRILESPYDIFNKWVVVFRRYEAPQLSITRQIDNAKHNYMSLGYGLYYRKDGWMLANMDGVLEGAKMMEKQRMNMSGWFIHNQEGKRLRTNHDKNRTGVVPYRIVMSHAFSFPGPNVGIFRAYLDNYEEVIRTPPHGQPAWSIVYPMQAWLPEIAKAEDQRINCYVFIHDLYLDDIIAGYNGSIPYQWRFWPIERKGPCEGPICKFAPHIERIDIDTQVTVSNQHEQAGQICDILADRGAPILCHTQDKEWDDAESPSVTDDGRRLGRDWKLAYTVIKPIVRKGSSPKKECSRRFTAFDLTWVGSTLFDEGLAGLVPEHYKSYFNPSEIL